jgi:hypothetical protein
MSGKRKSNAPAADPMLPRETAFQDAVVLVREPFVIDRTVAMQAMQFAQRFAGNGAQGDAPSSQAATTPRRRNGTTGR